MDNGVVDIGHIIEGIDGETSMIIATTIPITPPIKLCDFLLYRKYCTDPRAYKNRVVPDVDGNKGLCTLGLAGFSPRWCKEYPRIKKEFSWFNWIKAGVLVLGLTLLFIVVKIGGFF